MPGDADLLSRGDAPTQFTGAFDLMSLGDHATVVESRNEGVLLDPGHVVGGRFKILRPLGMGGMGVVYQVADQDMAGEVKALKMMRPSLLRSDTARERFVTEARIAQKLAHENIVNTFDLGRDGEFHFITMEYLEGHSLDKELEPGKVLAWDRACRITFRVLKALEYAHRRIIHRDLKPQNLFLCDDGTLKVLDFGLARIISGPRVIHSNITVGTPAYMAPEQEEGQEATVRSDLYSVGVVFYQCLAGKMPRGRFRLPSQLDSTIPAWIDTLIEALLDPYPENRPENASAVSRQMLEGYQGKATPVVVSPVKTAVTTSSPNIIVPGSPKPSETKTFAGIKFVWIRPGSFMMGSPDGEVDRAQNEGPLHRVSLAQGFWMGKYPVTQAQWQAAMGNNPSHFKGDDTRPVETVSWNDCQAFVRSLSTQSDGGFRLPSEAEWEYACRAGTTTRWYCGDNEADLVNHAWYVANSGSTIHPVGQKRPNPWGLYDMHGNVWEWCQDWFHDTYTGAPADGSPWEQPVGQYRVLRGGSWGNDGDDCRSAYRAYGAAPVSPNGGRGFRVVRTP